MGAVAVRISLQKIVLDDIIFEGDMKIIKLAF
jgi:hypothetical protein